ncbi:MAG: FAD-dependent oxidoreductase [Filomicrobium sp.]
MPDTNQRITILGAGVYGLWQAFELSRRGHQVALIDIANDPIQTSSSSYAGAMLAPFCEAEAAPEVVRQLGVEAISLWQDAYPGVVQAGTLVLAPPRDRNELERFATMTSGHEACDATRIGELEPALSGRFASGLFFAKEAHMPAPDSLQFLLERCKKAGATIQFGNNSTDAIAAIPPDSIVVDCRGMGALKDIPGLRGVRGERVILTTDEISLTRAVRLLHPRHPIYVVPWGNNRFMVGATVIESEAGGKVSVRSMLELLGAAFALHPAFAEAEITDLGAGVRPAYDDNVPRVQVNDAENRFEVNGAYRHGFLLAPVLASCVADYIAGSREPHPLVRSKGAER